MSIASTHLPTLLANLAYHKRLATGTISALAVAVSGFRYMSLDRADQTRPDQTSFLALLLVVMVCCRGFGGC